VVVGAGGIPLCAADGREGADPVAVGREGSCVHDREQGLLTVAGLAVAVAVHGGVGLGEGLPTVYVSGDNASLDAVREIAERFAPVDTAILFAGAPRFPETDRVRVRAPGRPGAPQALKNEPLPRAS
jgi:hypothetical protein